MDEILNRVRTMAHVQCENLDDKMAVYSNWSESYEEDVFALKYTAPHQAVKMLYDVIDNYKLEENCDIIDFAAGTGLVGKCLREKGFTGSVDGQDGCDAMLRRAKQYRNTFCCILEPGAKLPVELTSNSYDVATISGALSPSQVDVDCIPIIIGAVRLGGYIVLTTRLNPSNLQYVERLESEMKRLELEDVWVSLSKRRIEEFELATDDSEKVNDSKYIPGVVYCFQKL
uniref:Uncharacterized protein LOC100184865 n=1 Tax=Phallusia mammillata TaxID=59560 RepID=A0A6F9DIT2_9ASCI|nr:uncharacterized protein LOC100184865 [Phallusia mammillata]